MFLYCIKNRNAFKILFCCFFCFFLKSSLLSQCLNSTNIYYNNFDSGVVTGWSSSVSSMPLIPHDSLGPFGAETVSYRSDNLSVLPCHDSMRISFKLILKGSWDGNGDNCCGPDIFIIKANGITVYKTTFENSNNPTSHQSYPAQYLPPPNTISNPAYMGSTNNDQFHWSTYFFSYTFFHSVGNILVQISQPASQGVNDESWYIDSFSLKACRSASLPFINVMPKSSIICSNDTTILTGMGALNYNWSPALGLSPYNDSSVKACPLVTTTYTVTGTNANCSMTDSAVILVKQKSYSTISMTICEGQNYLGQTSTGTYLDTFIAANGCDSIRTLNLIIKPITTSIVNQSICHGQLYLGYTTSGTYIDTFVSANGCDSIRTLNLIVKPKTTFVVDQSICHGQSYFGYTIAGTYIDTFVAVNGCDSIRTLNLIVRPKITSVVNQSICQGQSYLGYTTAGTYIDTFIAANRCDSVRTLSLIIAELPKPFFGYENEFCKGDSLILSPGGFLTYLWQDNSTSSRYIVKSTGLYSVIVTNACGSKSEQIFVAEKFCNEAFSSAFTPNQDGDNDYFKILNAFKLNKYRLSIYNRYGQKVFETSDYNKGWDGTLNGNPQDSGTFVYYCRYIKDGKEIHSKGAFVLFR